MRLIALSVSASNMSYLDISESLSADVLIELWIGNGLHELVVEWLVVLLDGDSFHDDVLRQPADERVAQVVDHSDQLQIAISIYPFVLISFKFRLNECYRIKDIITSWSNVTFPDSTINQISNASIR